MSHDIRLSDPNERVPVVDLPGGLFTAPPAELNRMALAYYREHVEGTTVNNPRVGRIAFTSAGADAFRTMPENLIRMSAVKAVRGLAEACAPIELTEQFDESASGLKVLAVAALRINGKPYAVKLTLHEAEDHWVFADFAGYGTAGA